MKLLPFSKWKEADFRRRLKRIKKWNEEDYRNNQKRRALFLFYMHHQLDRQQQIKFRDYLSMGEMWKRDRRIPRCALLDPSASPWEKLYSSGNDQAMITITGFDHKAFRKLVAVFKPYFNSCTPWTGNKDGSTYAPITKAPNKKSGRPRMVTPVSCVGLALAWHRFKGAEHIIQGWFGFTGTHANVWIKFTRRVLLKALINRKEAKVSMPSVEKVRQLQQYVSVRHPSLTNVYCVADGLKLFFEKQDGLDEQSMFYNGWQHDHYVSCLFVFSVDGRLILCLVNAPGSVHDSTLAHWGHIYEKLAKHFAVHGGKCCVDSAFMSGDQVPCLMKSSEDLTSARTPLEMIQMREATSLRQAAEWGMRAIQSAFPRLKDRFHLEHNGERKVYTSLVCLLYNFRLEEVGLNQIRNVYCPSWETEVDGDFLSQLQR